MGLAHDPSAAGAGERRSQVVDVRDDGDRVGVRRIADEVDAGFDFGAHGAGAEVAGFEVGCCFVGRELFESLFVRLAVVDAGVLDGGEDDERRRFEAVGQQAGGAVLVDNRRCAVDDARGVDVDGDAAAAAADNNLAGVDEPTAREAFRLAGHKLPVACKFLASGEIA